MSQKVQSEHKKDTAAFFARKYVKPKDAPTVVIGGPPPAAQADNSKKPGFTGWGKKDEAPGAGNSLTPEAPKKSEFKGWGKKDEAAAPERPASDAPALPGGESDD